MPSIPSPTNTSEMQVLRPLGALERMYHLWSSRHPMHHCLTVQLDTPADLAQWRRAVAALRRRHPLLGARVVEDSEEGPRFVLESDPDVTVLSTTAVTQWTAVVAAELAVPLTQGRLFRATVLPGGDTAVLVFGHEALDGRSAVEIAGELPALLAGQALPPLPLPPSREELLAASPHLQEVLEAGPVAPPQEDPRLQVPAEIRPFDGIAPVVSALELDEEFTGRLRSRCRAERSTLHAALVTALAQVVAVEQASDVVRVMSPIDVRGSLETKHDLGLYIHVGRTLVAGGGAFWDTAREQAAALASRRSAMATARAAAAQTAFVGPRAGVGDAERLMTHGALGLDVLVSNLGALPAVAGIRSLWGPSMLNQVVGEQVVGALTMRDRLHLTCVSHDPTPDLLERAQEVLRAALG